MPSSQTSPDFICQYVSWSSEDAVKHYLNRISSRIPQFQTMEEKDLNYIKVCAIAFSQYLY
jgi:hypothetical protein